MSRAVGITAARASHWRAQFLAAGQAGRKSRAPDARDEDHRRLQAKVSTDTRDRELEHTSRLISAVATVAARVALPAGEAVEQAPKGARSASPMDDQDPKYLEVL